MWRVSLLLGTAWLLHLCLLSHHQLHLGKFIQRAKIQALPSGVLHGSVWVFPTPSRAWGLSSCARNFMSCWDLSALELSPGQPCFALVQFAPMWPRSTLRYFVTACAVTRRTHSPSLLFLIFSYFQTHNSFGAFVNGCIQKREVWWGLMFTNTLMTWTWDGYISMWMTDVTNSTERGKSAHNRNQSTNTNQGKSVN